MAYTKECIETFLRDQGKLFDEPVAENEQEAQEFLEDCFAVVANDIREVKKYFEESGADIEGLSDEELKNEAEVFALPSGKFLIVEG